MTEDHAETLGDRLRELSAFAADAADSQQDIARTMRYLEACLQGSLHGGADSAPVPRIAWVFESMAYRMRTFQLLNAEVARAHDAMVAAGGPSNARAQAEFSETLAWATALLPTDFDEPLGS
ncbi:MAG: hypothetical protein ACRDQB_12480 [Thermocrispum sp.]